MSSPGVGGRSRGRRRRRRMLDLREKSVHPATPTYRASWFFFSKTLLYLLSRRRFAREFLILKSEGRGVSAGRPGSRTLVQIKGVDGHKTSARKQRTRWLENLRTTIGLSHRHLWSSCYFDTNASHSLIQCNIRMKYFSINRVSGQWFLLAISDILDALIVV